MISRSRKSLVRRIGSDSQRHMRTLDQILRDLRSGENLDLYVTVLAALALTITNLLGWVPTTSLNSVTLTILALVAITILGNRHRLQAIIETAALGAPPPAFIEDFPTDFKDNLDAAHEVWIAGTHHSAALTAYYSLFQRKLERGGRLKVLLVKPDGAASLMATMRFPGKVTSDQEKSRILSSLSILQELKELAPERVQIRVIDFLVDYTAFFMDPESPRATIYLERYTFRVSGGSRKPKFVYQVRDGRWFEHIKLELEALWVCATDWTPTP